MSVELLSTPIEGLWQLVSNTFSDNRGSFLNAFRHQEPGFQKVWGKRSIAQVNLSCSELVGTVRGFHLQSPPYAEAKLVRCIRGRVWDVAVDLRCNSSTYGQWHAVELSSVGGNALMIPEGCAHGFQVLESRSELLYLHSGCWVPDAETGVCWNDPTLAVNWPKPVTVVSDRDSALPLLEAFS